MDAATEYKRQNEADRAPILTDRLTLRMLCAEDAPWIAHEIANPKVLQWLTTPPSPYGLSDAQGFVALFQDDVRYRVLCDGDMPLGVISMGATKGPAYELGYWLAEHAWGRGFMSEAARAMIDWHWARSTAPLISGWIQGNAASAQILTQLGFIYETTIERRANYHGRKMPLERLRLKKPYRPLFTVRTERLILNATTLEDVAVLQQEFGRPEVARMMATVSPNWTYDEAREWLILRLSGTRGFGRAIRLQDGTFIGSIGAGGNPRNLGYMLAPKYWGQGYVTEALRAFLPAAFAHFPDIDVFGAEVYDDNPASVRVLEKLGFVREGAAGCQGIGRVEAAASSAYRVTRAQLKV